jgi:hypothetical protein
MTIGQRFQVFLDRLSLTPTQRIDGYVKLKGVVSCLNKHYYGISSPFANNLWVGSWAKSTEIRPPRDIDFLFILPECMYFRYQLVSDNRQSRLLQEVKGILEDRYSGTEIRGDGQVVTVPFQSYSVEVVPAFDLRNGQFFICDTHFGGRYKATDPIAEIHSIDQSDSSSRGSTRDLIRMMKRWQEYCDVPLKSFCIELLCTEFLDKWEHAGKGYVWYDWLVRDFLDHLITRRFCLLFAPGTGDLIFFGETWRSKAVTAYRRAVKACTYDYSGLSRSAAQEWQGIFGPDFPAV